MVRVVVFLAAIVAAGCSSPPATPAASPAPPASTPTPTATLTPAATQTPTPTPVPPTATVPPQTATRVPPTATRARPPSPTAAPTPAAPPATTTQPPAAPGTPGTAPPAGQQTPQFLAVIGAAPGGRASVAVQTTPGAYCSISYVTPLGNVSEAASLVPKNADASGSVNWTWLIGGNTRRGTGTVRVTCNGASVSSPIPIG